METFGRVLTAMVTPFDHDLKVDYEAAVKLAQRLLDNGSDGLVVLGTTGESPTLTKEEKIKLCSTVVETVGGKATVIAGVGTNSTAATVEMTRELEKTGVDAVMAVAPYYNKPSQEGLYRHFRAVAEATPLPLMVYNIPGRTGVNVLPDTLARLAKDLPNMAAVKEASGDINQIAELRRIAPPRLMIYSGDDALTLPVLSVGGVGIVSVASHLVGKQIHQMVDLFFEGKAEQAAVMHGKLLPFFRAMFVTTNPVPVKTALNLAGIKVGGVRLPLCEAAPKEVEVIKTALSGAGLLD